MKEIIGQTKLVNKLLGYSFNTMPKTLLLVGDQGAGKSFITKKFTEHLGVELVELNAQTTSDQLIEYLQSPIQAIYSLNLSEVAEKQQHKYLKFIEEPSSNMRIILRAESEVGILPTILNRCEANNWVRVYGTDPIEQATAPNQFVVYQEGYYERYINGNAPEKVKIAVQDALAGVRNHNYLSFRSGGTTSYSDNRITDTGNRYK